MKYIRLQFSLRSFLLFFIVIGILCGLTARDNVLRHELREKLRPYVGPHGSVATRDGGYFLLLGIEIAPWRWFKEPRVYFLSFTDSEVTQEKLDLVSGMAPDLADLSLANTGMTDATLEHLPLWFGKLDSLRLDRNNLSYESIVKTAKELPNLRVLSVDSKQLKGGSLEELRLMLPDVIINVDREWFFPGE